MWAVVTYRKRGPLCVDGPYRLKADALDVKRQCDEEERAEPLGNRARVVRIFDTLSSRQWKELIG
jgi:hypothetical protein